MSRSDRRSFLTAALAAGVSLFPVGKGIAGQHTDTGSITRQPFPGRVVIASAKDVPPFGVHPPAAVLRLMVERAMLALTREATPNLAWTRLFTPGETIAWKANCLGGRHMSSSPDLFAAAVASMSECGFAPEKQTVFERSERELGSAAFDTGRGWRVAATDQWEWGYTPEVFIQGAVCSRISRLVTSHADALVNFPKLKDHNLAGVSGSLKNLFGVIHNPNKYHGENCDPFVADVALLEPIRRKHRLILMDALEIQFHRGPAFFPAWAKPAAAIIVATDPVAADRVGWDLIEELRRNAGLPTLRVEQRLPKWLMRAGSQDYRLGIADPGKIERIEVEV